MDTEGIMVGVVITVTLVAGIGGVIYLTSGDSGAEGEPEALNDSEVTQQALDSKDGAGDLKSAFNEQYDSDNTVQIQPDGQVVLSYETTAQNGNQLKDEMKQVSLLYADVAADNPDMGSLTVHTGGVEMIVPADLAVSHGNGDINEAAFFENVRFE